MIGWSGTFVITCISLLWFGLGAVVSGWMMHCGRMGKSPLPPAPTLRRQVKAESNNDERPAPRVGI